MYLITGLLVLYYFITFNAHCNGRLLELNDKFVDIYKDSTRSWLIKFYAPWCHHCLQLEPIYKKVADIVEQEGIPVIVGRIDCSRYTTTAQKFKIRGFPTVLYIDSERKVEYIGGRNEDDIVDFARRISGPAIRKVNECNELPLLSKLHPVYFIYFGTVMDGKYVDTAKHFHANNWFYHYDGNCPNFENDSIYAIKRSIEDNLLTKKYNSSYLKLNDWIREERFPKFVRVNMGNINQLLNTYRVLVIALFNDPEVEIDEDTKKLESKLYSELEYVANIFPNDYFIFGYTHKVDIINSIAIQTISPLPNYIIINSTDMKYYLNSDMISIETINKTLNDIQMNDIKITSGGNDLLATCMRLFYDIYISFVVMYVSSPVLTLTVIGIPLAVFSVIIYALCCTGFTDRYDEFDEYDDEDFQPNLNTCGEHTDEEEEDDDDDDDEDDNDSGDHVKENKSNSHLKTE